jgi:hypothetical protein
MEHSARIFNCARCHRQVIICSCCDRGNIYCGPVCSQTSRKEHMRAAGKRYQKTYDGRMNHAKRQRRYKKQKINSLTHHPSQEISTNDLLQSETNKGVKMTSSDELRCHFCGRSCSLLLRTSPLNRDRTFTPGVWPLGP